MTGAASSESGTPSPPWRCLFVALSFLVLWPLICGIVIFSIRQTPTFGTLGLRWFTTVAIYSYAVCGPPALLVGIIHAVAAVKFHQYSIVVPLVATVGAVILTLVIMLGIQKNPTNYLANVPMNSYVVFLLASLIASLVCWRLTRRFARVA